MDTILSILPPHEGILPKWLVLVSLVSVGNSIQAYSTTDYSARVYTGPLTPKAASPSNPYPNSPVTPLSTRTFGTWTLLSSIIRLYAAYHVGNRQMYEIAFWTYSVAWGHFLSEWLVYGTARLGKGLAGPLVVSTLSMVWMWTQWDFYVR